MPKEGYHYHLFISYPRGGDVEIWVKRYFYTQIQRKLTEELGSDARIFYDQHDIRTGASWERTIVDAARHALCVIPVWSPTYFTSKWCVSEWASFRERAEGIVVPVAWGNIVELPPAAASVQCTDVREYALTASAFEKHNDFVEFEKLIRSFVQKEILPALKRAPDFNSLWPVVVPKVTDAVKNMNVKALQSLQDVDSMYVREPFRIQRLVLAA